MIKLDRILVPTDFSEHAGNALQYAKELAERFGSELHLLHVLQDIVATVPAAAGLIFASAGDFIVEQRRDAEKALKKLADSQELTVKRLVAEIRGGQPFLEIVRYAREKDIGLDDIPQYDFFFTTGSVQELKMIKQIDQYVFPCQWEAFRRINRRWERLKKLYKEGLIT